MASDIAAMITRHLPMPGLVFILILFVMFVTDRFPPVTVAAVSAVVGAGAMIALGG